MNADLWLDLISQGEAPLYPCPHCDKGILLLEKGSLTFHSTVASLRAQPDEGWDPDVAVYAFSCWLKCAAPKCGGFVAVVGRGHEDAGWDDELGTVWEKRFRPRFAWPMPPVFPLPQPCPDTVTSALQASFAALWSDQSAAASRLRVAIEYLLDEIGVQCRRRSTQGYERLSLHVRIELLAKAEPQVAANLMAIKWLGNTGTHEMAVTLQELLSAYEIMEHAMESLLRQRARRADVLAKELTHRHANKKRRHK
jgi:hypothetical protein